ncbi:MAG: ceramidase domain-containing protein [Alphaproteobacteria bacterium]|nr:ceramidase domain-containing protein [Alphaproteobacteria bacterium]
MIDWNKQLFSYCERALDPSFWAEPVNAFSNVAFLLAALAALNLWLRQPATDRRFIDLGLITILVAIGVGSFLFHTYATVWAVLTDVIPITVFMLVYLACALKRFMGLGWIATAAGVVVFYLALQQAEALRCGAGPCLNGSLGYVPALLALLIVGGLVKFGAHPAGQSLIAAGLIFAVSLTLRTIDRTICDATDPGFGHGPIGTHSMWHVLNAALLYILIRASILYGTFSKTVDRGLAR